MEAQDCLIIVEKIFRPTVNFICCQKKRMEERREKSHAGMEVRHKLTNSHVVGREALMRVGKPRTFQESGQLGVPTGLPTMSFCTRGGNSGKEKDSVSFKNKLFHPSL